MEDENLSQSAPEVDEGQAPTAEPEAVQPEPTQAGGEEPQTSSDAPVEDKAEVTFEELAKKKGYKSPDDLAKSYSNLEKRATKAEQGLSGLNKVEDALRGDGGNVGETNVEASSPDENVLNDPTVKEFEERLTKKAKLEAKQEILDELAPDIASTRVMKATQQYPDLPQYSDQIVDVFKKYPALRDSIGGLVDAYKIAKGTSASQEISDAKEKGKAEAYQNQEVKQASRPETAAKASGKKRSGLPSLSEFKNMTMEEKEEIYNQLPDKLR